MTIYDIFTSFKQHNILPENQILLYSYPNTCLIFVLISEIQYFFINEEANAAIPPDDKHVKRRVLEVSVPQIRATQNKSIIWN